MKKHHSLLSTQRQEGVALILTLSVLAMILVLIVSYATLSRIEANSAGGYRDYVSSRYFALSGLNRAMADVSFRFSTNASTMENGVATISSLMTTNAFSNAGVYSDAVTDIEKLVTNGVGKIYTKRGKDDVIDTVVLPGIETSDSAQWIGIKGTNGLIIGRTAYILTSGGLNLNAIGNLEASGTANGPEINTRNEGVDASELNLVAALMAAKTNVWSYDKAVIDAQFIMNYRNGAGGKAGTAGTDDNQNNIASAANSDQIDNDGDGKMDGADPGEGTDEPKEHLATSDGRDQDKVQVAGDNDCVIQDLKWLYTPTSPMGAEPSDGGEDRFEKNIGTIQRYFVPQSSYPLKPTMVYANTNDFKAIYNQLKSIPSFATNSVMEIAQAAANVLSFTTNSVNYPFIATPAVLQSVGIDITQPANSNSVIGVTHTPYVNQVLFTFALAGTVYTANLGTVDAKTNINLRVYCTPQVELWYPYTNDCPGGYVSLPYTFKFRDSTVLPTVRSGWDSPTQGADADNILNTTEAKPYSAFTGMPTDPLSAAHFATISFTPTKELLNAGSGGITPTSLKEVRFICVSNLSFNAWCAEDDLGTKLFDQWKTSHTNMVGEITTVIPTNVICKAVVDILDANGGVINGSANKKPFALTNIVSFALNDPRVKTDWGFEYIGMYQNNCHSLGKENFTKNLPIDNLLGTIRPAVPLFSSNLGEDKAYNAKGIAPKTFWVKNDPFVSVGEMGRVHRGQPWKTIDLKASGIDGAVLDSFSMYPPTYNGKAAYVHGAVNINARPSEMPTWAALFAGMPFKLCDQTDDQAVYFDIVGKKIDPDFPQCKALGKIIGNRAGKYTTLSSITMVPELSNLSMNSNKVFKTAPFNQMKSDEDKEYLIQKMSNLISTRGNGNVFTVWSWGQTVRSPSVAPGAAAGKIKDANRMGLVTAESMLVGIISPSVTPGSTVSNLQMNVNYIRWNPDTEILQEE